MKDGRPVAAISAAFAAVIGLFGCSSEDGEVEGGVVSAAPAITRCDVACLRSHGFAPQPPGVLRNQVVGAPVEAFLRDVPPKEWLSAGASTADQVNEAASGPVDETMAVGGGEELLVAACRSGTCEEKGAFIVKPGPQVIGAAIIRAYPGRSDPRDRRETLTMFLTAGPDQARFERAFTAWAMQSRDEGRIVQRETVLAPAPSLVPPTAAGECAGAMGAEFPGPPLGATYDEVSKAVPASARCQVTSDYPCSYVEPAGYRITFTESRGPGPPQRYLFMKSAERGGASRLPFGIGWSDTVKTVAGKLNRAGVPNSIDAFSVQQAGEESRRGIELETPVCFDAERVRFYMTFVFEDGHLLEVLQRDPEAH